MNTKLLAQLSPLFRSPFLRKIAVGSYYRELNERLGFAGLSNLLTQNLEDVFERVYELLLEQYRCEYVFKNELIQHWFKSKRSLQPSYVTDEFRVGKCRVDLAVFSGTSIAFEIKTEFDSAARLRLQSCEYAKVFDLVYVVTTHKMLPRLIGSIPHGVGILTLESCGGFTTVKDSMFHANQLDMNAAFNCLRQSEKISVAEMLSRKKIDVPNSKIYTECKRVFRKLLPFEAHEHVKQQLRNREYPASTIDLISAVPRSLKHVALTLRATHQETRQIKNGLKLIPRNQKQKTKHHEHLLSILAGQAERVACA